MKVWLSSLHLPKRSLSQKHNQSYHCHSWLFREVFTGVVCRITFQGGGRSFKIFKTDISFLARFMWSPKTAVQAVNKCFPQQFKLSALALFIGSSSCVGICSVTTETRWRFKFVCQILTIGASSLLVKSPEIVRINFGSFVCSYFWGVCALKHTQKGQKNTLWCHKGQWGLSQVSQVLSWTRCSFWI